MEVLTLGWVQGWPVKSKLRRRVQSKGISREDPEAKVEEDQNPWGLIQGMGARL